MPSPGDWELVDRPLDAAATAAVLTFAVYAGCQLTLEDRVDLSRTTTFAVVFAATLVDFSLLRRRVTG